MGSPGAVLVLDEDINLRVSLAQILKQAGYVVSTACSPCEARKLLEAHPFGLIFLDIGLMAGVELVLSPYLNSGENFSERADPMVHFLVKPIDPATILEVIRSIMIGENRPS